MPSIEVCRERLVDPGPRPLAAMFAAHGDQVQLPENGTISTSFLSVHYVLNVLFVCLFVFNQRLM